MNKCLCCQKKFIASRNCTGKYCGNICQQEFQRKKTFARIREIKSKPPGVGVRVMKQYIAHTRGANCKICKLDVWNGAPILLILDHIDGNSDNWGLRNLRLLCSNCDATTNTYKNRNAGNGRHARRIRYAEGKSF
jgi:hypothetical protein